MTGEQPTIAPVSSARTGSVIALLVVFSVLIVSGLYWLFTLSGPVSESAQTLGAFWWIFAFAAGLSMIVLPCTLPLAFVIVPLSMGRGVRKGLGMALSFGIGVTLTLSLYGILAALFGKTAIGALGSDAAESIKNWVYFIAGTFALLFALGEIGLLKLRMPSYSGAAPAFIQKRGDYLKALLLGLFLGNIGVGCPHPATPLILIEIASSGDVLYGWLLFLVHAIGRVLPLLFLACLGILGINGLSWVLARKERVARITGWAMVFVAGFILTLGLFSHDWWVNSGIHTQFEKLTREEAFLGIISENIGAEAPHVHGVETGTGLFGLPLAFGNWFLVLVWLIPIWWWWAREKRRVATIPETEQVKEKDAEHRLLVSREKSFAVLSVLLALVFIYILPHNFLKHESNEDAHGGVMSSGEHDHPDGTQSDHADEMAEHMDMMENDEHVMMDMDEHGAHGEGQSHEEWDVTEGLVSNFNAPKNPVVGTQATLQFFVNMKPEGTPVTDLQIEHEKYYHLIGVRDDLSEFFHLHPEETSPGNWTVEHVFEQSGTYKLWSDIKQGGTVHSFGHPSFTVADESSENKTETIAKEPILFLTNVMLADRQVSLHYDAPLVKGVEQTLHITVKDLYGNGIALNNYLGAKMHLVIIKDDLSEYVHTHPGEAHAESIAPPADEHDNSDGHHGLLTIPTVFAHGAEGGAVDPDELSFTAVFPSEGVYKLFAQFRPADAELASDEVLLAEFYVNVAKEGIKVSGSAKTSTRPQFSWWTLFIVSVGMMSVLSYGVHRYLQNK